MTQENKTDPADPIYNRIASIIRVKRTFTLGEHPWCPSVAALIAKDLNAKEMRLEISADQIKGNLAWAVKHLKVREFTFFKAGRKDIALGHPDDVKDISQHVEKLCAEMPDRFPERAEAMLNGFDAGVQEGNAIGANWPTVN